MTTPWEHLPRLALIPGPTPVHPLPRLGRELGLELWVKRDDLTGLAFGGNKTRKLEFLLAEAQAQHADTVVTAGAVQSNHCRQTAAAAARLGLQAVLVLAGEPTEPARGSGNLALDALFGAQVVWTDRAQRDQALRATVEALRDQGRRPYLIPYGGSNPLGASAYARALAEALAQMPTPPAAIVLASSSGGTQAGLVAGARVLGYRGRIVGISVDEPRPALAERVAELASQTLALWGRRERVHPTEVEVHDVWARPGYGVFTAAEAEAMRLAARREGLLVDPVYTGRGLAGLLGLARERALPTTGPVLFWHTGGTPALFAQPYLRQWLAQMAQ